MALTKTPKAEVGLQHAPDRSRKYFYQSGESFVTIAEKFDLTPLELIWLNFKTANPREVNWYLREYCGCHKTTKDGKNYLFSDDDRRDGGPGWIWVPRSVIEIPPIEIQGAPPSGVWYGLGLKIDAGAGVSLTPLYAYLFSHDRYGDQFLMYMDGRSATVGLAFGVTPVIVVVTGVTDPLQLNKFFYEGEWDLQLKLGGNWGKILKAVKGSKKAAPLVNVATKLGKGKLTTLINQLKSRGKLGQGIGTAVAKAAKLSPDEWVDLRQAIKGVAALAGVSAGASEPKVEVIEIPFVPIPGVAVAMGKMMAEVQILDVSHAAKEAEDPEATEGKEFE